MCLMYIFKQHNFDSFIDNLNNKHKENEFTNLKVFPAICAKLFGCSFWLNSKDFVDFVYGQYIFGEFKQTDVQNRDNLG